MYDHAASLYQIEVGSKLSSEVPFLSFLSLPLHSRFFFHFRLHFFHFLSFPFHFSHLHSFPFLFFPIAFAPFPFLCFLSHDISLRLFLSLFAKNCSILNLCLFHEGLQRESSQ